MKKLYLFLITASIFMFANAAILTVDNNTISGGKYSLLQTAINNAAVDDTILISGSPNYYDVNYFTTITIQKRLTIIGVGYDAAGVATGYGTSLPTIILDSTFTNPITGIKFIGVYIYSINTTSAANGIQSTFERCRISYCNVKGPYWMFNNCHFIYNIDVNNWHHTYFFNCVFSAGGHIYRSNANSVIIDHCFFNCDYGGFDQVYNALITNNIFWQMGAMSATANQNNTFNNNLTWGTNSLVIPAANNFGTGNNFNNVDPKLTNVPLVQWLSTNALYQYDFTITNATYKTAATDGTELGIYGGLYPYPNLSGKPSIPVIQTFNINNSAVLQNGTLNVTVVAKTIK